ncbi:hypothetical protein GGI07_004924 [Coemansia sp. Benny D115]|nr:hypothetical protein GGI07_004924 [Coemansia sp. Benny D115]
MNPEYRSVARILGTGTAPNIISEVTRDLLARWKAAQTPATVLSAARQLVHLGQYITTLRIHSAREQFRQQAELERNQRRNVIDGAAHFVASGLSSLLSVGRSDSRNKLQTQDQAALLAVLRAAEDATAAAADDSAGAVGAVGALALVGGLSLAIRREKIGGPDLVSKIGGALACIARNAAIKASRAEPVGGGPLSAAVLAMCIDTLGPVDALHIAEDEKKKNELEGGQVLRLLIRTLFDAPHGMLHYTSVLSAAPVDAGQATQLVADLVRAPGTRFGDVCWLIHQLHAWATDLLVTREQQQPQNALADDSDMVRVLALLHVLEAALQRYFVEDAYLGVPEQVLADTWTVAVDCMAAVHFTTLRFGRGGAEVFKRATTLAVQFALTRSTDDLVDTAVRQMLCRQPCLAMPQWPVNPVRAGMVLFYLDLLEHLVARLHGNTLATRVLPLAARYAQSETLRSVGPEWFESAHALMLAALELAGGEPSRGVGRVIVEAAPWYGELVLRQYPDQGISADLLRISYTACTRAISTDTVHLLGAPEQAELAWTLIQNLCGRIDQLGLDGSEGNGSAVRRALELVGRRELLLVLADQVAAVPLAVLPRLMHEIERRLVLAAVTSARAPRGDHYYWAVVDELQEAVLAKTDVARKPALSRWLWHLRARLGVDGQTDNSGTNTGTAGGEEEEEEEEIEQHAGAPKL